jgi:hypothetical protein
MGFGNPTKYLQLDISKVPGGVLAWDRAVQEASDEYKSHVVMISILIFYMNLYLIIIVLFFIISAQLVL